MRERLFSKNIYNSKSEVLSYDNLRKLLKIILPLSFLSFIYFFLCVYACLYEENIHTMVVEVKRGENSAENQAQIISQNSKYS